jgi:RNA polymerase sigma factor (sigma-70 family)
MRPDFKKLQSRLAAADESAFRQLVDEHGGLVYQTALRRLNGDHALAQDAAQNVFVELNRKAGDLPNDTNLPAWLYRQTCFVTGKQVRTEERRRLREAAASESVPAEIEEPGHLWNEIKLLIDSAIGSLGENDRNLLLLRFWGGKSLREAGEAEGISENAAQKRITRAFDSLRTYLTRYGVTGSAATLTLAFGSNASAAVPAGYVDTIATAAMAAKAPSLLDALNPMDWFVGLKTKPVLATGISLLAISLGTTGFVAGRKAAQSHKSAVAWQHAVDQTAAAVQREESAPSVTNAVKAQIGNEFSPPRREPTIRELVAKAAEYFRNDSSGPENSALAFVATRGIPLEKISAAVAELNNYRGEKEVFENLGPIFAGLLAKSDVTAAIKYAEENFTGTVYGGALREIIREWAHREPKSVWSWYNEISDSGELPMQQTWWSSQANDIFSEMTAQDPAAAFAELKNISLSQKRGAYSGITKAALGSDKRSEILDLLNQLPNERQKLRIARDLAGDWAKLNPTEAADWAATLSFENPAAHLEVLGEVAEDWAITDPHAAGKWLIANAPEPMRAQITEIVKQAFTRL